MITATCMRQKVKSGIYYSNSTSHKQLSWSLCNREKDGTMLANSG